MSSVTSKFSKVDTGVFWDLDRCPVPMNLTPASIYDNIKLSLGNLGYTGTMSIVAYSSKKLKNEEDFESANIKLLQPENKHERIMLDVYSWGMKHRYQLTNYLDFSNLMVISEDFLNYLDQNGIPQVRTSLGLACNKKLKKAAKKKSGKKRRRTEEGSKIKGEGLKKRAKKKKREGLKNRAKSQSDDKPLHQIVEKPKLKATTNSEDQMLETNVVVFKNYICFDII